MMRKQETKKKKEEEPSPAKETKDDDKIESSRKDDRYAVVQTVSANESTLDSALDSPVNSISSESSGTGSTGTSFETDDTDEILQETFDEEDFDDIELLTVDTNPILGGWVDSACGWLDKPMCSFLAFGKETSLLKQSKGRTKAAIQQIRLNETFSTVANMKLSAAQRRNLRLARKGISKTGESSDEMPTWDGYLPAISENKKREEAQFFKEKRIQPILENDNEEQAESKEASKNELEILTPKAENLSPPRETEIESDNDPSESNSIHSMSSSVEAQVGKRKKRKKKQKEKETIKDHNPSYQDRQASREKNESQNSKNDTDREDQELTETLESVLSDEMVDDKLAKEAPLTGETGAPELSEASSLEIDEITSIQSDSAKVEEMKTVRKQNKNISTRSERSEVRTVRKNKIMEVVKRSRSVPRARETEITDLTHIESMPSKEQVTNQRSAANDGSLPKPIEIIDVLSMDDQDSWTPGAPMDPEPTNERKNFSFHSRTQQPSKSRDPSPSLSMRNANVHARDPSPLEKRGDTPVTTLSADDLWNEEEAKLKNNSNAVKKSKHRSRELSNAENAADLWDEEEQKLRNASEDIFDDPKAREAFLGHRRGRLQDTGLESHQRSPSQSRRRMLVNALKGGEDESDQSRRSNRSTRSRSYDLRKPPAPELGMGSNHNRSLSLEKHLASHQHQIDSNDGYVSGSSHSRVNRNKDLVAIRSIEDAQRLRSSQWNSNSHEPIDVHDYMARSSSRGHYNNKDDGSRRSIRSSIRRPKSRDVEIVDLANVGSLEHTRSTSHMKDARDDRESRPKTRLSKRGVSNSNNTASSVEAWPDYETVISATKELRKLEKKIEKQLRQAKRGDSTKKKKEEWEAQSVSSKEIRKLEKQLAQKLKRDNEKRATKLKRIKRKGSKSGTSSSAVEDSINPNHSSSVHQRQQQQHSQHHHQHHQQQQGQISKTGLVSEPSDTNNPETIDKAFSQKVDDYRERSKFDQLRALRSSRYLRSSSSRRNGGTGGRSSSRSPEDDRD